MYRLICRLLEYINLYSDYGIFIHRFFILIWKEGMKD